VDDDGDDPVVAAMVGSDEMRASSRQAGNNDRVIDQSIARIAIAPSLLLHQPPRSFIT